MQSLHLDLDSILDDEIQNQLLMKRFNQVNNRICCLAVGLSFLLFTVATFRPSVGTANAYACTNMEKVASVYQLLQQIPFVIMFYPTRRMRGVLRIECRVEKHNDPGVGMYGRAVYFLCGKKKKEKNVCIVAPSNI